MDELEISGKRYISTRRAAKEYKYSADYIGQLVRGKKVVGQKVGRSWYVDAASLLKYLGEEAFLKTEAPVPEKLSITPITVHSEPQEEKVQERVETSIKHPAEEKKVKHIEIGSAPRTETAEERLYRIPINTTLIKEKKGLVYLTDDEPMLPALEKRIIHPIPQKQTVFSESESFDNEIEVPAKNMHVKPGHVSHSAHSWLFKSIVLVIVGIFVFVAVLGASAWMHSTLVVEEEKGLKTRFSL